MVLRNDFRRRAQSAASLILQPAKFHTAFIDKRGVLDYYNKAMPKKKFKLKPHFGKVSIILIVVAAVLIVADLLTKHFADIYRWEHIIIPGFAEIQGGHHNTAAAFGGFDIGQPALIVLTFILLAFLVFAFICLPEKRVILKTAIAIVIAGAIGNLVDRIWFSAINGGAGYVRDWFGLWIFVGILYCNFADFYIVIGVALVAASLLFFDEWAVFPLTKSAKAAQAARKAEEDKNNAEVNSAREDAAETENNKTQEQPPEGNGNKDE